MALFSRRHYVAIEKALRLVRRENLMLDEQAGFDTAVTAIENMLAQDNPMFERQRFLNAIASFEESHA